ncbi:MAG: acetylornithine transaminase [Bacillota bacterium]
MDNREIVELGQKYVMNTYGRVPMAMVKGQGAEMWDADDRRYLDFVTGLAVNSLGHCHPRVAKAVAEQAQTLIHCSNLYWIEPQVKLAQLLVENSDLDKVFFCNSGAEANEGAIKLARKYMAMKEESRYEIITMSLSFHGRTLAALAATAQVKFHQGFAPMPVGFSYVPFNDLKALETAVNSKTCAVMLEPVQGEGGVNVAELEYLRGVAELCRERGLLLILDEVQCGLGRTGSLFAYQQYGIKPDIVTLAKALGGGVPIGCLMAREEVAAAFIPGDHGSTFGGNPLASAAGVAALTVLLEEGLIENTREVGDYFTQELHKIAEQYPFVVEIRGKGLLLGMELSIQGAGIVKACQEQGLLINCTRGNVLRFLPPLNVTEKQVNEGLGVLRKVLAEVEVD